MSDSYGEGEEESATAGEPKFVVSAPEPEVFEKGQKPPPCNTSAHSDLERPYLGSDEDPNESELEKI